MRLPRSRLTDQQSERLLEHFVAGTPARSAAALIGVNRNTARLYYHRLREVIAEQLSRSSPRYHNVAAEAEQPAGERARDGARRTGARAPLFGLYAHQGKVRTVLVRSADPESLPAAPESRARLAAIVYADGPLDRGPLDVSRFRHRRVDDAARIARGRSRIDRIESFWSQAKRRLRRYNGIPREHLHLFLKECEWRFNYGAPAQLQKLLKTWIKRP